MNERQARLTVTIDPPSRQARPVRPLPSSIARCLAGVSFAAAALVPTAPAVAQWRRVTSPVWQPPVSIVAPDDALAVTVDPAAMALLRGWSLVYVHAEAEQEQRLAERGDGLYAATPLPWGFALGAALDAVRPTRAALEAGAIEHTALTLALGWAYGDALAVGAASRLTWSGDPRLAGLFTLDLAASWRPSPYLAAAFLARDVTGPGYQGGGGAVPRSFVLGFGIRPTGTRVWTIDLAGAADENGRLGARLASEVEVPYVGRVHLAGEAERLEIARFDFRLTAGVVVDWGQVGLGGGVVLGDGFPSAPGGYVTARLEESERVGVPTGAFVADVAVQDLGARGLLETTRRLEHALRDPRIRGVLLRMRASGIGLAHAQELRMLVDALQDAGKPVACHLADASGAELYACAGARAVIIDPAGGIRLYGPAMEIVHLAGLLRELDVRADFVRIGPYKTAIEEFQDDAMSQAAREARESILDDLFRRLTWDVSRDLRVPQEQVRQFVEHGPYLADEAVEAGLADVAADERDMDEELEEAFGGSYAREQREPTAQRRRWGRAPRVGVVVIDGEMIDGENLDVPLLDIHATGGRTAVEAIDRMARDPAIAAIVVRLETPGGSVLAADQIWRAIRRAHERKPVIASMGAVAASGGYYVASACDEIWADPATLTGSIGVWFGKIDVEPLATRFGVRTEQLARGRYAGMESLFRPFTPEERALLAGMVRRWYRTFLRRVAQGRGMRVTEVDAVARGRVWTGDRALELGLIDRLGGFHSALVRARELGSLPDDAGFEVQPSRPATLLEYVLGETPLGGSAPDGAAQASGGQVLRTLAPGMLDLLRAAWVIRRASSTEIPLARLEWWSLP